MTDFAGEASPRDDGPAHGYCAEPMRSSAKKDANRIGKEPTIRAGVTEFVGETLTRCAERRLAYLRIMCNRAAIVGATLAIEPAKPTGTVVPRVLPRKNNEPSREPRI